MKPAPSLNMSRIGAVLTYLFAACVAAQDLPGSYAGSDSKGLTAAVAKNPENLGLHVRLALAQSVEAGKGVVVDMEQVSARMKRVLEADPEALVPLRWLVRDAYYMKKYDQAIEYGRRVLKLDPSDLDVATFVVKALIRVGREDEAVASLTEWFRTGYMPPSGATQGILSAVILNQKVKQGLDAAFPRLVDEHPNQVLVRLAFASFLAETGKGEEAWREFHAAEKGGLCDAASGQRHPLAQTLKKWDEPEAPGAVGGGTIDDLSRLASENPEHAGLAIRMARRTELPVTSRRRKDGEERVTDPAELERLEQAVAMYLKAYDLNPDSWPPLFRAGELEMERGRYAEAVAIIKRAAEKFPDQLPTYMVLAEARFKAGDPAAAAQDFLPYASKMEPGKPSRVFFADLAGGDPKKLAPFIAAIEKECTVQPRNARLRAYLSVLRLMQDDRPGAQAAALEAERLGLTGLRGWPHQAMIDAFAIDASESRESK